MTADYAAIWIGAERHNQWRLEKVEGTDVKKVSMHESDSESFQESLERLNQVLPILAPGKYQLKAWSGKSKQASQDIFEFEVKRSAQLPVNQSVGGSGQPFNLEEYLEKARQAALVQFEFEQWKKELVKRVDALEKNFEDLAKSVQELHDDDDENDGDAFQRVTDIAGRLPKLTEGFKSMQGLFTKAV
jgi:hypothetical protein